MGGLGVPASVSEVLGAALRRRNLQGAEELSWLRDRRNLLRGPLNAVLQDIGVGGDLRPAGDHYETDTIGYNLSISSFNNN